MIKIKLFLFLFLQQNFINFVELKNPHYLTIEEDKNIFFWLFKKLKKNELEESITFWFQGGPGCSSMMANFEGCGEYRIDENNEIKKNIYSWSKLTNMVFLDFPYGTGFSKSKKKINYPIKIEDIKYDLIIFIDKFLKKFPEFKNMKIYFAAESYATRFIIDFVSFYIKSKNSFIKKKLKIKKKNKKIRYLKYLKIKFLPNIKEKIKKDSKNISNKKNYKNKSRKKIKKTNFKNIIKDKKKNIPNKKNNQKSSNKKNKEKKNKKIDFKNIIKNFNIKGLILLSGFIDPYYLNMGMLDFSIKNNLIKKKDINYFKNQFQFCGILIRSKYKLSAANFCFNLTQKILGPIQAPFFNKYDIRLKCEIPSCYDYSKLENLMNNEDFQKTNGISNFENFGTFEWKRCNRNFMKNLKRDSVLDLRGKLKRIKDNKMKLFIIHGNKDFISNFNGIFKFSELFFGKFEEKLLDGYSEYKNSSVNLYKVFNSGHMVAKDQPEIAYNLFESFLKQ